MNAGVIGDKEFVAEKVRRQEKQRHCEVNGAGASRERWRYHVTVPYMVRDSSLAYRGTDDDGREV